MLCFWAVQWPYTSWWYVFSTLILFATCWHQNHTTNWYKCLEKPRGQINTHKPYLTPKICPTSKGFIIHLRPQKCVEMTLIDGPGIYRVDKIPDFEGGQVAWLSQPFCIRGCNLAKYGMSLIQKCF